MKRAEEITKQKSLQWCWRCRHTSKTMTTVLTCWSVDQALRTEGCSRLLTVDTTDCTDTHKHMNICRTPNSLS